MTVFNIRDDFADISATIEELALSGLGFELVIAMSRAGGFTGDAYRTYTDVAGLTADAELSAAQRVIASAPFQQTLKPDRIHIAMANSTTPETYAQALDQAEDAGLNAYFVCCESRADADVLAIATWVSTRRRLYIAQSGDASWLTAGIPAGLSALSTNPRVLVVYHPTATQGAAEAIAGSASAVDPNRSRIAFTAKVSTVTAYTLTATEAGFAIDNNALIIVPPSVGASTRYPYSRGAKVQDGEYAYAMIAKDLWEDRVETQILQTYLGQAAKNQDWPFDDGGRSLALADAVKWTEALMSSPGKPLWFRRGRVDLPDGYDLDATMDESTFTITVEGDIAILDGTIKVAAAVTLTRGA